VNRLHFHSMGRTDAGAVRRLNEDAFLARPEIGLWAVADGMGGHSHGDEASRMVVDTLAQVRPPDSGSGFIQEVRTRLSSVHDALQAMAKQQGGAIIGATAVVLMIYADRFVCLWAGDSRLYLLRNRQLWQITRDHSYVQELVDSGVLAVEAAQSHPEANVITRAVGAAQPLDLDMERSAVLDGDIFLLCSDGLTKVVTDAEIANLLDAMPPDQATTGLINLALGRGAPDNVTVVALACIDDDRTLPPGRVNGARP
jgi:serine/threonine protein phosphatase PrpC